MVVGVSHLPPSSGGLHLWVWIDVVIACASSSFKDKDAEKSKSKLSSKESKDVKIMSPVDAAAAKKSAEDLTVKWLVLLKYQVSYIQSIFYITRCS